MTELNYKEPTFKYQPERWEIDNGRVRRLAERRSNLNRNSSMLLTQISGDPDVCISNETVQDIRDDLAYIGSEYRPLKRKNLSDFDQLVVADVMTNARAVRAYMDYFFMPQLPKKKEGPRIEDCIKGIFGKGSVRAFRESLEPNNFPHEAVAEYTRAFHPYRSRLLDSMSILDGNGQPIRDLKEQLKENLKEGGSAVDGFVVGSGIATEPGEYNLQFARAGFSYWDAPNLMAAVDEDRILCSVSDDGKYGFFNGLNMLIMMHEVGGHMQHDFYQDSIMPREMVVGAENWHFLAHSTHAEGTALAMEGPGLKWMDQNKEKLGLTEKDIELTRLFKARYIPSKLPKISYGLANIRERTEGKGDAERDLANLTGVSAYHRDHNIYEGDEQAWAYLHNLTYFFGEQRTKKLVRKMRDKKVPKDKRLHALLAGVWSDPKAQEKFIFKHYLPAIS